MQIYNLTLLTIVTLPSPLSYMMWPPSVLDSVACASVYTPPLAGGMDLEP